MVGRLLPFDSSAQFSENYGKSKRLVGRILYLRPPANDMEITAALSACCSMCYVQEKIHVMYVHT